MAVQREVADASHQLYIVELEKLKVVEASYKAFKNLDMQIGGYLKNLDVWFRHINPDADVDASVGTNAPAAAATTWPLCIQHLFCFILIRKYNHHIVCSKYWHLWESMIGSASH